MAGPSNHRKFRCRRLRTSYEERLLELFRESVQARLAVGRPTCSELSGGLDSSSIVCMADRVRRETARNSPDLITFSYTHENSPDERFYREVERACEVRPCHLELQEYPAVAGDRMGATPAFWEPRFQELASQMAAMGSGVLLTGQFGDFVTGNYPDSSSNVTEWLAKGRLWKATREAYTWGCAMQEPIYPILWSAMREAYFSWVPSTNPSDATCAVSASTEDSLDERLHARLRAEDRERTADDPWRRAPPGRRMRFRAAAEVLQSRAASAEPSGATAACLHTDSGDRHTIAQNIGIQLAPPRASGGEELRPHLAECPSPISMTKLMGIEKKPTRAKVAIVHPGLGSGGSEAAALWSIEALKNDYDVTFISLDGIDLERLNAYYGTALAAGDFSLRRAPLPLGLRNTKKFDGLKGRFLLRYVQRIASEFDLLISCYGPMDFGKRGVQMIADFSFVDEWRLELHPTFQTRKTWFYGDTLVRRIYLALCDRIAVIRPEAWKQNITLANSAWSADRLLKKYEITSQVVYPPVILDIPQIPATTRDRGFICLGRVSPEKCVHSVIEILRKVRERGHNVHLHLLGGIDNSDYGQKVRALAGQFPEWVFLEGWVQGDRKKALLAGHRFGINACPNEAFGIAVAEMVLAGCVVFVPNGGGQVEIVNHPSLIYDNDADAVDKIDAVLKDAAVEDSLRSPSAGDFNHLFRAYIHGCHSLDRCQPLSAVNRAVLI